MNPVARALLITILIAGLIGGSLSLLVPDNSGLRRPALAFFETWWNGEPTKSALATVFDGAPSASAFDRLRERWQATLGTYDGPGEVVHESSDAQRGSIVILLNFEKGAAEGHFDFSMEGQRWKLKNFRLERKTGAIAGPPKPLAKRIAKKLVECWAQNEWRMTWEWFEPELRAQYQPDPFSSRTGEILAEFGKLKEVQVTSQAFEDEKTLKTTFSAVFEEGTRRVSTTLIWIGEQWRLTAFSVEGWAE
jgi:hypothetical protein